MDVATVTTTPMPPKKLDGAEPPFRKPLRRAVALAGGIRPLSARTQGRLPPTTIHHLLNTIQVLNTRQAIILEEATHGAVNRLEFFPELIIGNDEALETVRDMVRTKRRPIR